MDYYYRIQNAIEFIEINLKENIEIIEVAKQACFSIYHFQRLFQSISGFSVQNYIRKRRLTEASFYLTHSDKSILEIAIDFQYGSQEAFTRAFESCFGITPAKYRNSKESFQDYQGKINFIDYKKKIHGDLYINKPTIINLNKTYLYGYEYFTDLDEEKYFVDIPNFYQDFGVNKYYLNIVERVMPSHSYGLSCNFKNDGKFSFVVGEAVRTPVDHKDDGFINIEIPEGKYAVFKVEQSVDVVQNIWRYIYSNWLPNSNYKLRDGYDFELIDVCSSKYPDKMLMKIFIPLK